MSFFSALLSVLHASWASQDRKPVGKLRSLSSKVIYNYVLMYGSLAQIWKGSVYQAYLLYQILIGPSQSDKGSHIFYLKQEKKIWLVL